MEPITESDARERGLARYFTGKPCKRGHIAERRVSDRGCIECRREDDRWANKSPDQQERDRTKRRAANLTPEQLERRRARDRARYERTKDQYREDWRRWHEQNRASWNARVAGEKAHIRRATPPWADRAAIAAVYAQAERLTRETGILHHVDHIIPLKHPLVCGLHVHTNLRAIPASENLAKTNRWAATDA